MPRRYCHLLIGLLLLLPYVLKAQSLQGLLDSAHRYNGKSYARAKDFAAQAYQKAIAQRNKHAMGESLLLIGTADYVQGNHVDALNEYLQAQQQYTEVKDTAGIIQVYNEMCVLYANEKKYGHADTCSRLAINYATNIRRLDLAGTAYNDRGLMFLDRILYDSAYNNINTAYACYKRVGDKIGMSYSLDYMSEILSERGQPERAMSCLDTSLALRIETRDSMGIALAYVNLGELQTKNGKQADGLANIMRARTISTALGVKFLMAATYLVEGDAMAKIGNYRAAYNAAQNYQRIHDEVVNEKRIQAIEDIQTRYDTEKKEEQNKLLSEKNKLQAATISRRNIALAAAVSVILLVAGISYLLYNRYRLRQQAKLQQELMAQQELRMQAVIDAEEAERQRLARELHDGVGQLLSAARRSLQNIADVAIDTPQPVALLDESIREVRQLSHSMMPPALRNKDLPQALDELAARTRQTTQLAVHTDWVNTATMQLSKNQTLMLYRAVQEIISNVIKHAEATELNIELVNHETEVTLMLYDNGRGFDKEAVATNGGGLGLKNISSRIAFIGGSLELDTRPGSGTTYIIDLPLSNS